jgi:TRAP-type uncharacterized transport system fused permease subunit
MQTGWESMRVGSIIYFIPFFFVLNPAFVLQGPAWEAVIVSATAAAGVVFICGGLQGYQLLVGDLARAGPAQWPIRVLLALGGITLAAPGGGIMPLGHGEMTALAVAILLPTMLFSLWAVRRN